MISARYHFVTLTALFLAMGLGILIGGTMGDKWMSRTEDHVLGLLVRKYEHQLEQNRHLREQLTFLTSVQQQVSPLFRNKTVVCFCTDDESGQNFGMAMKAAGAVWVNAGQTEPSAMSGVGEKSVGTGQPVPDLLVVLDRSVYVAGEAENIPVLDLRDRKEDLNNPEQVARIMIRIQNMMEEQEHEREGNHHHPGLQ